MMKQAEWIEQKVVSCGLLLRWQENIIEQKCSNCQCWSIKWETSIPSNYCPHCGYMMKGGKME